jgi:O-antigen ligase
MNAGLTRALAAVVFVAILTCWAPAYWPAAALQAGAFFGAGVWLIHAGIRRRHIHLGFGLFPLTGLLACGAWQLAAHGTEVRMETAKSLLYWAANAAVFFVTLESCGRAHERNRFLRAVLWFGFGVSLMTVLQYFTSGGKIFWLFATAQPRVLGPFLYNHQCAAFIELVFPLAVYQSIIERRHSLLYVTMAASMFAVVMAATSRAGAVLVAAELAAILTLAGSRGRVPVVHLGRTVVGVVALGLALSAVVGWQRTAEKFRDPEPYRVRRELLASSLTMIAERPWSGFGLGAWSAAYRAYARFDNGLTVDHAHNDWAEWAVEGGVPFFLLMALLAGWTLRPAAASLWGVGVPVVFVHSLVDFPLREPAIAALLFAIMGALAVRTRTESRMLPHLNESPEPAFPLHP